MISLPDVTLLCIATNCHELTRRAINKCLSKAYFGGVWCFSDQAIIPGTRIIEPFASGEEYGRFLWYGVPWAEMKTTHVLLHQWDSWIINADQWTDEFLEYDYTGSPWWYTDGMNVGNGGFCLLSAKLMQFLGDHRDEFPYAEPQDEVICRNYRPQLEAHGFTWAPEELARRFSFECVRLPTPTFGYHGVFNMPQVMSRVAFAEFADLIEATAPHVVKRMLGE